MSASPCRDWLPVWGSEPTVSPPRWTLSLPSFLPPCASRWRRRQQRLHFAAATRLLLLGLDVVMDLELGLVGLLCGSVLQLPGRPTEVERVREREKK